MNQVDILIQVFSYLEAPDLARATCVGRYDFSIIGIIILATIDGCQNLIQNPCSVAWPPKKKPAYCLHSFL